MSCELCGEGDRWIKTCIAPSGYRLLVCDLCYEEHSSDLVIIPGDKVVTARCDSCGVYSSPREFQKAEPGGRKDAYSGTCGMCGEEC